MSFRIEKYIEEGEDLVAIGWIKLMAKDGKINTSPVCDVWKFRNGKMAQLIRSFASENWNDSLTVTKAKAIQVFLIMVTGYVQL